MENQKLFAVVIVFSLTAGVSHGYSKGAPKDACGPAFAPHHQKLGEPPIPPRLIGGYKLNVYADGRDELTTGYVPGQSVEVELEGPKGFLGFLIGVRNEEGDIANGTWSIPWQQQVYQGLTCVFPNDAITHFDGTLIKKSGDIKARWTAAESMSGPIKIQATVVVKRKEYYIMIESVQMTRDQPTTTTTTTTTTTPAPTTTTLSTTTTPYRRGRRPSSGSTSRISAGVLISCFAMGILNRF